MNTEESPVSRGLSNEPPSKPRFHPVKVFAVLVALVALSLIAALIVRQGQATVTEPIEQPDYSLTDAEAIARFNELKQLRDRAYYERDLNLVPLIYSSETPLRKTVGSEIKSLKKNNVIPKTRFVTRDVQVLTNASTEIRLLQTVDVFPKFVSESGEDVTESGRDERREVRWTLILENRQWLVDDVLIVKATPLEKVVG